MSHQRTLQQQRAAQAYKHVNEMVDMLNKSDAEPDKKKREKMKSTPHEYGTIIRGFPALIQTDGLATALAFLQAKAKKENKTNISDPKSPHHYVEIHISKWVLHQIVGSGDNLLEWLLTASTFQYRQATAEALAYCAWLKRFVEANDLKSSNS